MLASLPGEVVDEEVRAAVDGEEEVGEEEQEGATGHFLLGGGRNKISLINKSWQRLTLGFFPNSSNTLGTVLRVWQMTKTMTMRREILAILLSLLLSHPSLLLLSTAASWEAHG